MYHRKYNHPGSKSTPEKPKIEAQWETQSSPFPAMTLSVPDLARELHISEKTAYKLVREPDFPSLNIGKRILINREGLQEWLNDHSALPLTDLPDDAS